MCFCLSIKRNATTTHAMFVMRFAVIMFLFSLCLGVVENLTSLDPSISERVVMETDLLQWILTRIKVKVFDSNRQYASEILAILLQDSRGNYQGLIRCLEDFLLFTGDLFGEFLLFTDDLFAIFT